MNARVSTQPQPSNSSVDAGGMTDIGRARDTNEDAFLIATLQRSLQVHQASPGAQGWFRGEPAGTLLIVADGMGGQGGGDIASRTAIETVTNYLLNAMPWVSVQPSHAQRDSRPTTSSMGLRHELSKAILAGDEGVRAEGAHVATPRMGTTLTLALVLPPHVYVAHVGDTRCYLLEAGQLQLLTTDHNLAQKYVEASPHPVEPPAQLQNVLWNALGGCVDEPVPQLVKRRLSPGAVLLLCSDGLTKHVSDEEIRRVLGTRSSAASRAAQLVELANSAGGTDNITAVVTEVGGAGA
jgi:protein phosphatase